MNKELIIEIIEQEAAKNSHIDYTQYETVAEKIHSAYMSDTKLRMIAKKMHSALESSLQMLEQTLVHRNKEGISMGNIFLEATISQVKEVMVESAMHELNKTNKMNDMKRVGIDWVELRNNFFSECTTETSREQSGKKVIMAPDDLFEWFKREISEYVG